MELTALIKLLKEKDEQGLTYLYDHYAAALNGIILRIVGSEKVAEEVLQQTFLKIWQKIDTYDIKKSTLFTWMSRIARNTAIDVRRTRAFKNQQQTDSFELSIHNSGKDHTSSANIDVNTLFNKIDKKHKDVLECVYLEGYTHSEAAEKLQLPLGTVKTRLRNSIKQLQEILKNETPLFLGLTILILIYFILCQ